MIYNSIKIKIKKYNMLYVFIIILIILSGCRSSSENYSKLLDEYANLYSMKEDQSSTISYNYLDMNPYVSNGFVWKPFVLPNEDFITLRGADFLFGYWSGANNPILIPEPGICRVIENSDDELLPKGPLKLVNFVSNHINPEENSKELVVLLSPLNQKPFAMIRLNDEGIASCFIALKKYKVSVGYGQNRKEIMVDGSETIIKVPFIENSFLKIAPKIENGIKEGDTLRIGRRMINDNIINFNSYNNDNLIIPTYIEGDLFIEGNLQSKNMGVDEYLKTSIFIGKKPFTIKLEPSLYTFAILRKNKLICLQNVNLKTFDILELSCEKNQQDEIDINDNTINYFFDASIMPSNLIDSKPFQDWSFASPNYFLLTSPNYYEDTIYKKEDEIVSGKKFNLIYQNSKTKLPNYLPEIYNMFENFNSQNNDFNNIYLGVKSKVTSEYLSLLRNSFNKKYFLGIPLGGAGDGENENYFVPYSSFTKIMSIVNVKGLIQKSNIQASNGALFYLFEPLPVPQNHGLLTNYVQQRFRLRITIPSWNSTNIVEMYINGNMHRRWILDRGNISKPYSISIEDEMSESKAFTVHWLAWGADFLPDFLTGVKNTLPLAITRDFCIDIVGDGTCHVEQE